MQKENKQRIIEEENAKKKQVQEEKGLKKRKKASREVSFPSRCAMDKALAEQLPIPPFNSPKIILSV